VTVAHFSFSKIGQFGLCYLGLFLNSFPLAFGLPKIQLDRLFLCLGLFGFPSHCSQVSLDCKQQFSEPDRPDGCDVFDQDRCAQRDHNENGCEYFHS